MSEHPARRRFLCGELHALHFGGRVRFEHANGGALSEAQNRPRRCSGAGGFVLNGQVD